jgi:xanthine dehydrogenase accessory factor
LQPSSSTVHNSCDLSMSANLTDLRIIIRGAGEMASGIAWRLHRSGFFRLLMTEVERPLAVRRKVSFCEAVYEGRWEVEGISAQRVANAERAKSLWMERIIPVLIDPDNTVKDLIRPHVVIDAILAKRNTGTARDDASLVIGLGPGFHAGWDVDFVVETNRGHDLGRVILVGEPAADTGVPGDIGGYTAERVMRSPCAGIFRSDLLIGTHVKKGDPVGHVEGEPVKASLTGIVRGLIRPSSPVHAGLKIGDIDPRARPELCFTISEKARAIAGGVLEGILMRFNRP